MPAHTSSHAGGASAGCRAFRTFWARFFPRATALNGIMIGCGGPRRRRRKPLTLGRRTTSSGQPACLISWTETAPVPPSSPRPHRPDGTQGQCEGLRGLGGSPMAERAGNPLAWLKTECRRPDRCHLRLSSQTQGIAQPRSGRPSVPPTRGTIILSTPGGLEIAHSHCPRNGPRSWPGAHSQRSRRPLRWTRTSRHPRRRKTFLMHRLTPRSPRGRWPAH